MPSKLARLGLALVVSWGGVCLTPSAAHAQRSGFVIGFGLGGGLISLKAESHGVEGDTQTEAGVFTDLKIGYAPSERLAIYYSNQASFFKLDDPRDDVALHLAGVTGVGVMYFVAPEGRYYLDGSLGIASFGTLFDDGSTDLYSGPGLTLGAGVALSDVWFVDVDLLYGLPDDDAIDYRTLAVRATIAVLSH